MTPKNDVNSSIEFGGDSLDNAPKHRASESELDVGKTKHPTGEPISKPAFCKST